MRLYKAEVLVKKVKTCYNGVNGGVMALKKASLACTVCGSRNYSIKLSATPKPKRLEVNKFCKHCSKYTIHKETRQEIVVKFIRDIFVLLKNTTWPTRKERWKNFISVIEYTAFFVVLIYFFDRVVAKGILQIIDLF